MTSPAYASEHAIRRATAWLLAFTVLFIVYASLYPFEFDATRLARFTREDWLKVGRVAAADPLRPHRQSHFLPAVRRAADRPHAAPLGTDAPLPLHARVRHGAVAAHRARAGLHGEARPVADRRDDELHQHGDRLPARPRRARPRLEARAARAAHRPPGFRGGADRGALACHARGAVHAGAAFHLVLLQPARALDWDWSSGAFAGFFAGYLLSARRCEACCGRRASGSCSSRCALLSVLARIVFRDQRLALIGSASAWSRALPLIWQVHAAREQTALSASRSVVRRRRSCSMRSRRSISRARRSSSG